MTTPTKPIPIQIDAYTTKLGTETALPRVLAAASLVAGAYLLLTGRRKAALAALAAGAAAVAAERPETIREVWRDAPRHLRSAQDFLLRAEHAVEDIRARSERIRSILSHT